MKVISKRRGVRKLSAAVTLGLCHVWVAPKAATAPRFVQIYCKLRVLCKSLLLGGTTQFVTDFKLSHSTGGNSACRYNGSLFSSPHGHAISNGRRQSRPSSTRYPCHVFQDDRQTARCGRRRGL